jgi:serine/threonine-protein kinase HipA
MISRAGQPPTIRRAWVPRRTGAELGVFLRGEMLGTIERRGPARYRFRYSKEALSPRRRSRDALSASLPFQEQAFAPGESAPFFEGLLPEGAVRRAVAEKFRLSEEDGFGLLAELGADCAGAVVVLPAGETPDPGEAWRTRPLGDSDLAALVDELPRDPLGVSAGPDGVRLSLGGIQDKLVLTGSPSAGFSQPLAGAPSTCLIKPEHRRYEGLAANEAFCLRVAGVAGLEVASTELLTVGSTPCLYVERFDRAIGEGGKVVRLHQEDVCQALGILPAAKYEANGGPSVAAVVGLLRGIGSPRAAIDVNAFVKAVLVNFLLGNGDAHGKNFALLYDPDVGVRLAPLYDVVSTAVYPDLTSRMAMAIGGEEDPERVSLDSWRELGRAGGLGGQLVGFVRRWTEDTRAAAEECRRVAEAEGWHRPVIDAIVDLCRERAGRLIAAG